MVLKPRPLNRFFTLLLAAFCLTAVGQSEYCLPGTIWDEVQGGCVIDEDFCGWQPDGNGDNSIGISDLLDLLGLFGDVDSDEDGIWDSVDMCTDLTACNFHQVPTEECLFTDAVGVCGGVCEQDLDGDGVCDVHSCGEDIHFEGYSYATVQIGENCWFAENCRYAPFLSNSNSGSSTQPRYYAHDIEIYGVLYNHPAVQQGDLCPNGWKVPSLDDMTALDSSNPSDALRSVEYWSACCDGGTNASGFNARAAGTWNPSQTGFNGIGTHTKFWTTSFYNWDPWCGVLNQIYFQTDIREESWGLSVRCLKD